MLGWLAVLHAAVVGAILFALALIDGTSPSSKSSNVLAEIVAWLWMVLATSWFLWPFVLIVHPGRSILRIVLPLLIAYPFYFVWSRPYSNLLEGNIGTERLGLLQGVELTPHGILGYVIWYGVGWTEAKKAARAGRLILEAYGFGTITPGAPNFSAETQEKYHIEINHIAGCVVDTRDLGHAMGYNVAMMSEIKRRCGVSVVRDAEDEDARWVQSYDDGKDAGRAEALGELQAGHLVIEVSDSPEKRDAEFEKMLIEQYQISLRRVDPNADPKMSNNVFGHAAGHNEIVEAEITRRFGNEAVESIWRSRYTAAGND